MESPIPGLFGDVQGDDFSLDGQESVCYLVAQRVKQRSYYPIFPPATGNGRDFNLDITKSEAFSMPVQPDVLILPSRLTCTAMDISNGTTVVNPGHLVKGAIGGSFAVMDIHPVKKELLDEQEDDADADSAKQIFHCVKDRIRVEVRRI